MLGTLYYSLFLALGILYSDVIFKNRSVYFKVWCGGIMGNIILMFGIVPFAMLFGFTYAAHFALAAVALACCLLFCQKKLCFKISKPYMPAAIMVIMLTLLICLLMNNHFLPNKSGGFSVGQSTYGDLQMHLGFITSIKEQGIFPPEYNLLSGQRLCYPFLVDSLSASLYLLGTNLRSSLLYPSFVFAALTVMGFYFLAKEITENKKSAVLACILFFVGGGFGFSYFFDGAKENPSVFFRMLTEYYKTPTNFNEHNIRWANPICDMIIPQRTTMAGWCVLIFALLILYNAVKYGKRKNFVLLGFVAASMPMIHTHSFLALGIFSASTFFAFLPKTENKIYYFTNWCIYGAIAILIAIPQLFFWTFSQSIGNAGFLRLSFNWVNYSDPYLWFWLKNWGIIAVFAIPAYLSASSTNKRFFMGAILIFAVAELVVFQPNEYDNNKLFFVTYMCLVILAADYFIAVYRKLDDVGGRVVLAVIVMFCATFSGVGTIAREYISGGEYETFTKADLEFADFVKENTPKNSVFATGNQHLNPICVLSGRTVYAGSELYVYFHGYGKIMQKRYDKLEDIYEGRENIVEFCKNNNISYILISDAERENYDIDYGAFEGLEKVYDKDKITLYSASNNKY